jgi:Family of unknown function (DUF5906)
LLTCILPESPPVVNKRALSILAQLAESDSTECEPANDMGPPALAEQPPAASRATPLRPSGIYKDRDELVSAMIDHAAVVLDGGKLYVVVETRDGFTALGEREAKTWFKNARLVEKGKRGALIYTNALEVYLSSEERLEFIGFTSNPAAPFRSGELYSTWRGLQMRGVQGQCGLMKAHLRKVVCGGDEAVHTWLFGFLAQMIQEPGRKLNSAVVIRGPKGCGKSTPAAWIRMMIGARHTRLLSQSRHVVGNFNEHLRDALFVQVEEAIWAGNKEAEGVLKSIISDGRLTHEVKGGAVLERDNFSRFWFNSNEDWVVPVSEDERRFLVADAVDPCPGLPPDAPERKAYFDALYQEAEAGGVEALLYELERHDYSAIDLRRPPATSGLKAQMRESLPDDAHWLHDAVTNGEFTDRDGDAVSKVPWNWDATYEIATADLLESFRAHVRTWNGSPASSKRMAKAIKAVGAVEKRLPVGSDGKRPNGYVLPPRRRLAERLNAVYGLTIDIEPSA